MKPDLEEAAVFVDGEGNCMVCFPGAAPRLPRANGPLGLTHGDEWHIVDLAGVDFAKVPPSAFRSLVAAKALFVGEAKPTGIVTLREIQGRAVLRESQVAPCR